MSNVLNSEYISLPININKVIYYVFTLPVDESSAHYHVLAPSFGEKETITYENTSHPSNIKT